ncbi:hypothetical protein JTE90_014217, partial [Oedothorax gibbosus]
CDDDVDEPRSEISVLFEEMPMGDVSEAWLYDDDDDEVMGVLTQNFVEIPDDEKQIGGEIDTPHRDFWTPMPIDDTTNLEKAIVLSRKVGEETQGSTLRKCHTMPWLIVIASLKVPGVLQSKSTIKLDEGFAIEVVKIGGLEVGQGMPDR